MIGLKNFANLGHVVSTTTYHYIIVHTVISIHSHTLFLLLARPASSLLILCMTFVPFIFPLFIKQISKPLLGPLLIDFGVFYSRCVLSHISYLLLFTYSRKNHARLCNWFLKRKSNILLGKFYLLLDSKLPSLGTCAWSQNRKMSPCLFGILITPHLEEKSTQQTSAY